MGDFELCNVEAGEAISDKFLRHLSFYTLIPDAVRRLRDQGLMNLNGSGMEGWHADEIMTKLGMDTAEGLKPVYDLAQEIQNGLPNRFEGDIRLHVARLIAARNPLVEPIRNLYLQEKESKITQNRMAATEALAFLFRKIFRWR